MPLREIEERYTLSEIMLQAWQSQEQGYHMRQRMQRSDARNTKVKTPVAEMDKKVEALDRVVDSLPKPVVDARGKFTLKHQTGEDALRVFAAMGLNFPSIR